MSGRSLTIALIGLSPLLGQRHEMATLGSSVLQHTDIARQALANHDTKAALDHVGQALAATDQIRAAANSSEEPLRVEIARDVDAVSTRAPAKRHGSADRLQPNSSVSQVSGTYNSTILNVSSARNHLLAAQTALNHGDADAAGTDLAAVQGDTVASSFNGELPLVQARDNLALAQARVRDGKYKDAILPLKSAARALDRFANQEPRPQHADMAARMSLELNAYADRIEKDHVDAPDRVAGWLDHVTSWTNSGIPQ